jgi:PTH1 family peptidyl-tRNA hydrolase
MNSWSDYKIKLIISIGNPGKKYLHTRHNAGHIALQVLEDNFQEYVQNIKICKSDVFMNLSGEFVKEKLKYYKLEPVNLLILHDDLDLALGNNKFVFARGPKVHNGINDIEEKLNSKNFYRMRIGIDNRNADQRENMLPRDYVLEKFSNSELTILTESINCTFNKFINNEGTE